jgi:hypothetical protein
MMQAESRMVPSEGRSHTRLQQALHCVYPPAANVASTTTNYFPGQRPNLVDILQEQKALSHPSPSTAEVPPMNLISHTQTSAGVFSMCNCVCVCLPIPAKSPKGIDHDTSYKRICKRPAFCLVFILVVSSRWCLINCYRCTFWGQGQRNFMSAWLSSS